MVADESEAKVNALILPFLPDELLDRWDIADGFMMINKETGEVADPVDWVKTLSDLGFLKRYHVNRHDGLIDIMLNRYSIFWHENIQNRIAPDPVNVDDIKLILREPAGVVLVDEEQESFIREYNDIKRELGSKGTLAGRAEELKFKIMKLALDKFPDMSEELKNESRDRIVFLNQSGKKIKSYSLKGGLR
jgi:hypothetical protein